MCFFSSSSSSSVSVPFLNCFAFNLIFRRISKYFEYVEDEKMLSVLFVLVRSGIKLHMGVCVFEAHSISIICCRDQLFGMYRPELNVVAIFC